MQVKGYYENLLRIITTLNQMTNTFKKQQQKKHQMKHIYKLY